MQALGLRATSRAFAPGPIPVQTLSNLLWASFRPDETGSPPGPYEQ